MKVLCRSHMTGTRIKCGHCSQYHRSVAEVRACAEERRRDAEASTLSSAATSVADETRDSRGGSSNTTSRPKGARTTTSGERTRKVGLAVAGLAGESVDKGKKADDLRRSQTGAELKLGASLQSMKIAWFAQVPICGYIVDFFAPNPMIVIEVDGSAHDGRQDYDTVRDQALREEGLEVLRFSNSEVESSPEAVIKEIKERCRKRKGAADKLGRLDLEWRMYRYGASEPEEQEPAGQDQRALGEPARLWKCFQCSRSFWSRDSVPMCRADESHDLVALCHICKIRPAELESSCARCAEAREVASEAAGAGARMPSGGLKQAERGQRYTGR